MLAAFVSIVSYSLYQNKESNQKYSQEYTLDCVLDAYGFAKEKEKEALRNLFSLSSIKEDIFPARQSKDQLVADIVTLIDQTQKHFFIRTGNTERWEVKPINWMNVEKAKILSCMKTLGFVDSVIPAKNSFDAICILGATTPAIHNRIEYGTSLIKNGLKAGAIILLGGERYVTKNIDGSEIELVHRAKELGIDDWQKLTETHLMRYAYSKSDINNYGLSLHVIDTPARDLPRPTTVTTILELISWLQDHSEIKSVLFISSQPNVKYQQAVIDLIFNEQKVEIDYEVVGAAVINVDNVQPMVGALGSYIWTISPIVLKAMHVQNSDQEVKDAFKSLYGHQAFMYQALPVNLK